MGQCASDLHILSHIIPGNRYRFYPYFMGEGTEKNYLSKIKQLESGGIRV